MSRYDLPCPACGVIIKFRAITWTPIFPCAECGEALKVDTRPTLIIWAVSFVVAPAYAWHLGYQGLKLVLVAAGIAFSLLVLGMFLLGLVIVPGYTRVQYDKSKPFERVTSLRLNDKPSDDKKIEP